MFTISENPNYGNVIVKDGKETFCPFQPPIPMPGENGGFTIMRLPCSTSCPQCNIIDDLVIEITCGCEKIVSEFIYEEKEEKKSEFQMKKVD